jgi:alpha-beta hydrolase superfamily lysophospholipase
VVLLHGILQNQNMAWRALAPTLANAGYCVYTMTYGKLPTSGNLGGLDDLSTSAAQVNTFIKKVRTSTKSSTVDLVGYSEGGYIARLYMKKYGSSHVRRYVGLAPVNSSPPDISGLLKIAYLIPGAADLIGVASPAFYELSHQPAFTDIAKPKAAFANVTYTNIATTSDEVATPYRLSFLPSGPNVTNVTVQHACPQDRVGHLGMPYDRTVVQMTRNALDPKHPVKLTCGQGFGL